MSAGLASLHIVRARARGLGADRLRAQLAVERLAAEFDPGPMLGPAAILVARRARLSLPTSTPVDAKAAFEASLRPLIAGASRPAAGFVPADAEAVLFADEAEFLACLARALAGGWLAEQWWWAALRIGEPRAQHVIEAWLSRPQAIAAALDALDRSGDAAAFVRTVGPSAAVALAERTIAAHGILPLARPRGDGSLDPAPAPSAPLPIETPISPNLHPAPDLALHPTTRGLPPPLQWPIVLAAALRRAPGLAHREAFAAAARRWLATEPLEPPAAHAGSATTPGPSPAARTHTSESVAGRAAVGPRTVERLRVSRAIEASTEPGASPVEPAAPDEDRGGRAYEDRGPVLAEDRPHPAAPVAADPLSLAESIRTGYGGVLFLLNLALALGLWSDFTRQRRDGLAVSPWLWLAAIGERLCGPQLRSDPLRQLLEQLAPDAEEYGPPDSWTISAAWKVDGRRRPFAAHVGYIRQRLCAAFGFRTFAPVRRLLLARPARVWLTATRLDATFEMATHPVQVRANGLDRDPGWIPAAGRDVRFHFQ